LSIPYTPGPEQPENQGPYVAPPNQPMPEGGYASWPSLAQQEKAHFADRKRKSRTKLIIGIVVAVIALCLCGGIVNAVNSDDAGKEAIQPLAGVTASTTKPAPVKTTEAAKPTPAKPKAKVYSKISERQWKRIAKNPDAYAGKSYTVYGVVTQFDSATGDSAMRADVAASNKAETYDYDSNTILSSSLLASADIVQDDEFKAKVTVVGSYSYDTQIGGNTTVPMLQVDSITRIN
jgi:hypothetical protein